jgi:hypothetical protein
MASNIDPSISLAGKPMPTMTLPDMLNLARGAQAYRQQAQQLNPVELERAMAERDVAVGTAQPRIQRQPYKPMKQRLVAVKNSQPH